MKGSSQYMDQSHDIIKRLEDENSALKEELLRLKAGKRCENDNKLALNQKSGCLSPDELLDDNDIQLINIVPIEQLQTLQDKFSITNGISSIILDTTGTPITQPSDFNNVCSSKLYSEAKIPIHIGEKHVADWKITMIGFGNFTSFPETVYGSEEKNDEITTQLSDKINVHFNNICDLLKTVIDDISKNGYNNVRLTKNLLQQYENEVKLTENESTFRSFFDNSVDGFFLIEQNGIVKEWSKGNEALSGISKSQAIGKNIWDIVKSILQPGKYSSTEIDQMREQLNEVVSKKEQTVIVRQIINQKTQQEKIAHTLYFPVIHPRAKMVGAISRDITEDVKRERELIVEKERLQALGDNYPDGCLYRSTMDIATKRLKIVYLSKPWEAVFKGIPTILDENAILDFIDLDDLPGFMDAMKKSAETMTNLNVELRFIFGNKTVKWAQISSHPHKEGQQVVWDGYILDITERKKIELKLEVHRTDLECVVKERTEELEAANEELYATNEELYATNEEFAVTNEELHLKNEQLHHEIAARKEVMQKLEDSESKMRNFIEQSVEGIVILDEEGRIIEWNSAQERITEIPREKAIGRYSWELYQQLMPKEQAEEKVKKYWEQVSSLLKTNNVQKQPEETEHILYIHSRNEQRYITMISFQIGLVDKYYLGEIMRDTTERKLIDLELERYRTQLEDMVVNQTQELIESKDRLTSLSDNLPGGVIYQMSLSSGQALRFTYISAHFVNMFHMAVDDVMDNSSLFFKLFHQDDQMKIIEMYSSYSSQYAFVDVECRVCLDSGETKWVLIRSSYHVQEDNTHVWDGFMVDITDKKNAEQELEDTRRRQNILIKVLQIVQSAENIPKGIDIALSAIGKYAGASRSYIFEKSANGKTIDNTYEWCEDGIVSLIDNHQGIPIEHMSDWFDTFTKGEYVCTSDISTLTHSIYDHLSQQGIRSILVLPLKTKGINYGFIGFDDCLHHKEWQQKEIELLISLSQIISSTTRRFWAEKSMQLSQQTMRTVLDNINASIYVASFDTHEVLFANKSVKDQMGQNVEGEKCWKVLQKGMDGPCDFCPNTKLLDNDKKPTGLYRWENQNQNLNRWFECTDAAIEWVDGRLVHMEYATDITDRRVAEEALRQSEELYRQLTVASPDAIVVCDPHGKVVFLSSRAKELFLINTADEDINKLQIARFVHPHDLQKFFELFRILVEDNVSFLPQLLLIREDGSDFFGEISSASVKNDDGKTTSVIMIIRDITERKMSEMELIRAKEKAEESDNLKSAFLANMSHEIRTPINGIIGFLNFLADDNLSPKRRHEYISVVNNSSIQLVKLIDDIIDVAKIEARQMSIRPGISNLNEFMNELYVFFDTYLHANNKDKIALLLDDSGFVEDSVIFIDLTRLRQVLSNLIGNAIKFTEKGFVGFGYRLLSPDKLEFWVEDSGIGLAPDQKEVIFERFRQAELTNNRRYGGTGLGLTISRSLVQMMGGDITVVSTEGEGSTFSFTTSYLPIGIEDKQLFDEDYKEKSTENLPFAEMAILLVEPEIMTFRYYEKLLATSGATLIHAQTVKQWIDSISQQKHINVVLADARVFQDEDDEALRQVKSIRAGLPLILTVPERTEYYSRIISDSQCNHVFEGMANYAGLLDVLAKYR